MATIVPSDNIILNENLPANDTLPELLTNNSQISSSNGSGDNVFAAIRTNVSRVLDMYFHNISDEFGYGAAIKLITTATPTTTATHPTTIASSPLATTITETPYIARATEEAATIATTTGVATIIQQHLIDATTLAATTTTTSTSSSLNATNNINSNILATAPSITYPTYHIAIKSYENCSALFDNYTQPQQGVFCNWTWDQFLCWPPTPAGVVARMHCPSGWHGINTKNFANRKCELDGHWGGRPNETYNPVGWTDYQPCFKQEVKELFQQMKNLDLYLDIAKRTRTLEIVGLILSLFALILSLIIFCNFRSLRNNRTKIHKNLFIAMVLQVVIRLTLYLDQAFRRGKVEAAINGSMPGIEDTPYLCEASYVLLEYARTAMFMWMFIEGLYLHNMVTVAVFQGRFPHTIFSLLGWGMPVLMTTVWATCTAIYTDSAHDCLWNYNLTPYYWILEGPRLIVILLNFVFLMNIIRVLVVKLRQSQASDIEQTRKAVRAAIVLLPLLGITNLLHLVPDLHTPWTFALWSYVTHFLTSFQGFFIAMIYCFLNGEVRAVLLKSLAVYMSVRGHPEWAPKRASMFSGAYNTAPETDVHLQADGKRYRGERLDSTCAAQYTNTPLLSTPNRNNTPPKNKRADNGQWRPSSTSVTAHNNNTPRTHITADIDGDVQRHQQQSTLIVHNNNYNRNNNNNNNNTNIQQRQRQYQQEQQQQQQQARAGRPQWDRNKWMLTLCFRGQKVLRVPPTSSIIVPPESVVFELSEQ